MDLSTALLAHSETFTWSRLLDSEVLVFLVGGIIAVCAIVGSQLRRHYESKNNARLKADMLERGFSAEQIARVIEADGTSGQESE